MKIEGSPMANELSPFPMPPLLLIAVSLSHRSPHFVVMKLGYGSYQIGGKLGRKISRREVNRLWHDLSIFHSIRGYFTADRDCFHDSIWETFTSVKSHCLD